MLDERFWSKVNKAGSVLGGMSTPCWEWMAGVQAGRDGGYGRFLMDGRVQRAHRLSLADATGMDAGDSCVLHRCDNRRCVRPEHLFLGTRSDNHADMLAKGRRRVARGSGSGMAKLTEEKVQVMRFLREKTTLTLETIGGLMGVNKNTASKICNGQEWKHVGPIALGGVA